MLALLLIPFLLMHINSLLYRFFQISFTLIPPNILLKSFLSKTTSRLTIPFFIVQNSARRVAIWPYCLIDSLTLEILICNMARGCVLDSSERKYDSVLSCCRHENRLFVLWKKKNFSERGKAFNFLKNGPIPWSYKTILSV